MPVRRLAVPFLLALFVTGCTPSAPAGGSEASKPSESKSGVNEGDKAKPAEASGTTGGAVATNDAKTPTEPAGDPVPTPAPVPVEPGIVPVTEVSAVDANVVWRDVQSFPEAVDLIPVTRGLLGTSSSGYYTMTDGGTLASAAIEAAEADVIGYWPDNAWFVRVIELKPERGDRSGEIKRQIMLMRLRSGKRWVPQEYGFEQRFDDAGQDFRVGNKGGLIVADNGIFTRVAGGDEDPVGGKCRGSLRDFVETRSGKLYTVCQDTDLFVQTECEDDACVAENAVKLPLGTSWKFTQQVPRQRHSVTLAGTVMVDEVEKPHLLHYETGGWRLESLAVAPKAMWPTKDGGLWILSGDSLMHRDPEGIWRKIALPAGATELSGAMADDHSEFFLAARVDGTAKLFATPAAAQKPPEAAADPGTEPTE